MFRLEGWPKGSSWVLKSSGKARSPLKCWGEVSLLRFIVQKPRKVR